MLKKKKTFKLKLKKPKLLDLRLLFKKSIGKNILFKKSIGKNILEGAMGEGSPTQKDLIINVLHQLLTYTYLKSKPPQVTKDVKTVSEYHSSRRPSQA